MWGINAELTTSSYGFLKVGKQTEGELIDPNPLREEGVALATFDLDENRTQRARYEPFLGSWQNW